MHVASSRSAYTSSPLSMVMWIHTLLPLLEAPLSLFVGDLVAGGLHEVDPEISEACTAHIFGRELVACGEVEPLALLAAAH